MDLLTILYIFIAGVLISTGTIIFTHRKNRLPYTFDNKKKQGLTNLDKMLSNIKKHEPPKFTEQKEDIKPERKESEHSENKHDEKKTTKSSEKKEFDTKSAIIYSSIIQRKNPKQ